uniref:KTSC domain-containing protein n=1 Tax=Serratia phage Kevin TaxID=3161161 RepID=A0AAU8KZU4_9CAUD
METIIESHKVVTVGLDEGGRVTLKFSDGTSTTISVSKQIQMGIDGPGVLNYYDSGREEFNRTEG